MGRARTWTVRAEEDAAIAQVAWVDVVERGLIWHQRDLHSLTWSKAGDFVELPAIAVDLKLLSRCPAHHRENRSGAREVHCRIAHGDAIGALHASHAEASFLSEVAKAAIGIANPKIAAAVRAREAGQMIGEGRANGREVNRYRHLGHKHNGIRCGAGLWQATSERCHRQRQSEERGFHEPGFHERFSWESSTSSTAARIGASASTLNCALFGALSERGISPVR